MPVRISTVILGALIACGPPPRHHVGDDGDDGPGAGSRDAGTADAFVYPDAGTNCADGTELIYTIDEGTEELSTFDPTSGTFHDLGWLSCPAGGARPNSMSIDRQAHAWVAYNTGQLFKVDLPGLSCAFTTWTPPPGVTRFGMGFSADTPGGTTETLYIAGGATPMLATIDLTTMTTTPVGPLAGLAEMTGTGNAELWGFMPASTNTQVVKFDKATGEIVTSYPLPELNDSFPTYAFAHWGGDFWIFLQRQYDSFTNVYRVDGTTGAIEGAMEATNRTIIGAGVSTCAPVVIE